MSKLWNKGFDVNSEIEKFTVGDDYIIDKGILKYDVYGSLAHARMLTSIKVLNSSELKDLIKGFNSIISLGDKFPITIKDEDCHTAIEEFLTKNYGDVGKKIHTGRSRNDQSLVAIRLYSKDQLLLLINLVLELCESIYKFGKENEKQVMPGYTHMQKAMPSTVGLFSGAFIESLLDDVKSLKLSLELVDQNPLGFAASYGVNLGLDRKMTANLLGFSSILNNYLYGSNSRGKIESLVVGSLSSVMLTLNKLCVDLMMFTMSEFEFFSLPKEFCTGSSIMPQKKNYDVLELVRAKYHVVNSFEFQIKGVISSLPSGYNRDFQLVKKPLINGFEETSSCVKIMTLVFGNLIVNKDSIDKAMTKDLYATDEAYEMVRKGIAFRDAYKKVGQNLDKVEIRQSKVDINLGDIKKIITKELVKNHDILNKFHLKLEGLLVGSF